MATVTGDMSPIVLWLVSMNYEYLLPSTTVTNTLHPVAGFYVIYYSKFANDHTLFVMEQS